MNEPPVRFEPSTNPVRYEPTTELPKVEWGPITDPAELALAMILSPPDLKELLPDAIPFDLKAPADGDRETDGDQSFWAGKRLGQKWHWIREWDVLAAQTEGYTHWLPASVRYLPARVEL